jgi:hypothetical protein
MKDAQYATSIRLAYQRSRGDAFLLFRTLLSVAGEIGMDAALACLEQCVINRL